MSTVYEIIKRPIITEKNTLRANLLNEYAFEVELTANRTQIKQAVEAVFGVNVTNVNTLNRQGKRKRTRYGFGTRKSTKRAIVSLAEGERIDIFGGQA